MEKNWLIRTKNNRILGPISKRKVLELIDNKSIKGDDEVCSGNGYWFFVKEDLLVDKYIRSNEVQGFNPVQEAQTVVANGLEDEQQPTWNQGGASIPSEDDLEYPEVEEEAEDITLIGEVDISQLNSEPEIDDVAEEENLIQFAHPMDGLDDDEENSEQDEDDAIIEPEDDDQDSEEVSKKSFLNDRILFTLAVIFVSFAIIAFYFRKRIVKSYINTSFSYELIPSANAQIKDGISKKKR